MKYKGIFFHAYDKNELPIYHTNVVMTLGDGFIVACLDSIKNRQERKLVQTKLQEYGIEIIPITLEQVYSFCANILNLKSKTSNSKIIMSASAHQAFSNAQLKRLKKYGNPIVIKIPTIEKICGASTRCMIAEVFFPL